MQHIVRAAWRMFATATLAACLIACPAAIAPSHAWAIEMQPVQTAATSFDSAAQVVKQAAEKTAKNNQKAEQRKAAKNAAAKKKAKLASGDFCLAQSAHGRCTITSVAMMLRRAAYLSGSSNWKNITEASAVADGWISGIGVKLTFKSAGYSVVKRSLKTSGSGQARTSELTKLLKKHPEGIAVYDPGVPHAVLLSAYDERTDTFLCADPAQGYAGKQIKLGSTWNAAVRGGSAGALAGFSEYWVIA